MNHAGHFAAIRMIVLRKQEPGDDPVARSVEEFQEEFEYFMMGNTGSNPHQNQSFLDIMGKHFSQLHLGLERIMFLKGYKRGPQSHEHEKDGAQPARRSAGSNADYAWITYWTNQSANDAAWRATKPDGTPDRPADWDNLWIHFLSYCYPKQHPRENRPDDPAGQRSGHLRMRDDMPITRPSHGPPYDYLGHPGVPGHLGKGAGALVEGFTVLYDKSKSDWRL